MSPGYPDSYPNLQMCAWTITVEKGYNISLYFEFFQTEKEFDILEVFDGNYGILNDFVYAPFQQGTPVVHTCQNLFASVALRQKKWCHPFN